MSELRAQAQHPEGTLARGTLWLAFGGWGFGIGIALALWLTWDAPTTRAWQLGLLAVCGGFTLPVLTAGRWAWRTRPIPVVLDRDHLAIGTQGYALSSVKELRFAVAHLGAYELSVDLKVPLQLRIAAEEGVVLPPLDTNRTLMHLLAPARPPSLR